MSISWPRSALGVVTMRSSGGSAYSAQRKWRNSEGVSPCRIIGLLSELPSGPGGEEEGGP